MRKRLDIKLFLLLLTCTGLIQLFSHMGTYAYESVFHEKPNVFSSGTMISSISLEGLTREEAIAEVSNKIQEWSKTSSFSLVYQDNSTELPSHIVAFDYEEPIEQVEDGTVTELNVTIDTNQLQEAVEQTIQNEKIVTDIEVSKLEETLITTAKQLQPEPAQFQLLLFIKTDGELANTEISTSTIKGISSHSEQLQTMIADMNDLTIGPNETFSFLNQVEGPHSNSEALSIIASGIYKVILPTNFIVQERHISKQLPSYSEIGYEAKVTDEMNLVFTNPNPYTYTVAFDLQADSLQVKLTGPPLPYQYEVKTESDSYSPKTVMQFSAKLSPNQSKILEEGKNGLLAKVYREAKNDNNQIVETTFVSEDFYPPVYRVVLSGLLPSESNNSENPENVSGNENTENGASSEQENEELNGDSEDSNQTNTPLEETRSENTSLIM